MVAQVRVQHGRDPQPSAAIIDSQSVKTSEGGEERGVDVHNQVPGRKRHIVVDTLGLLLKGVVHSAAIPEGPGGKLVLAALFKRIKRSVYNRWCRLKRIGADGAYPGIAPWVKQELGWRLEVVTRPEGPQGFVVLPRRWVVERPFAWLLNDRRHSRDYERQTANSEARIQISMIHLLLKRLA